MRKNIFYILIVITIFLNSCSLKQYESTAFSYIEKDFYYNNRVIKGPQLQESQYSEINKTIFNKFNDYLVYTFGDNLSSAEIDVKYEVVEGINDSLCIVFKGEGAVPSTAYSSSIIYSICFNMDNEDILKLEDITVINDKLVSYIKDTIKEENNEQLYNYIDSIENSMIIDDLQKANSIDSYTFFYITKDDIIIFYPVPNALGDYCEVKLSLKYLNKINKVMQ